MTRGSIHNLANVAPEEVKVGHDDVVDGLFGVFLTKHLSEGDLHQKKHARTGMVKKDHKTSATIVCYVNVKSAEQSSTKDGQNGLHFTCQSYSLQQHRNFI